MTDIHPERFTEIAIAVNAADPDLSAIPEVAGSGTDEKGEYLELTDGFKFRRSARGRWFEPGWSKYHGADYVGQANIRRDLPSDNW